MILDNQRFFMPRHPRIRTAFTLTELLVVIMIIAILIAVLIPTISSVRRSAWAADTRNLIGQISNAITRYYQDFNAYPGPFSDGQIVANNFAIGGDTLSGAANITQTENLTLALLGGLRYQSDTFDYAIDRSLQSQGPYSLNPGSPRQYSAYLSVGEANLARGDAASPSGLMSANGVEGMNDSIVPEFMDTWPPGDQLPIVYLRARRGASGILSNGTGAAQYDMVFLNPYLRDQDALKGNETAALAYLTHPSLPDTPVGKDAFVLIAPGPDRIYGTRDDITSWGN